MNERKAISDKFPGQAPEDIDDLQAFHNLMQSRRSDFYKDQAKRQAISWKRETVRKQQLAHQKWTEEGKLLREKKEKAEDWDAFLAKNKLPKTSAENLLLCRSSGRRSTPPKARARSSTCAWSRWMRASTPTAAVQRASSRRRRCPTPSIRTASRSSTRKRMRAAYVAVHSGKEQSARCVSEGNG